jgi:Ca2+:H+ antiporter
MHHEQEAKAAANLGLLPALRGLVKEPMTWGLAFVPLAVILEVTHAGGLWIFLACCAAIIPLAGLMGRATENLAETMGPGIGGLLNATFGNAAELIIALMFLWKGPAIFQTAEGLPDLARVHDLVKATITGSIIGNILLVLGLAMLCGGFFHKRQEFNRTAASMGATLMALATIGLIFPTLHFYLVPAMQGQPLGAPPDAAALENVELLSEEIAGILAFIYLLSLLFSLRTHQHLFAGPAEQLPTTGPHHQPEWSRSTSLVILLLATVLVAVMSEFLVESVKHAGEAFGMNEVFIGVIVVAAIGNAAEHSTAVLVAMKNKMDLAVNIAIGSSLQIALFVAPVLVFAGLLMGHEQAMDLHFTPMEVAAVVLSVGVLALVCQDGETHWMEGVMLLGVYVIIALAFYHLPRPN